MLHNIGKELENQFEGIQFIGIQQGYGPIKDVCTFNCLKTGTTFCGNNESVVEERLNQIRNSFEIA
jgi:hypothetical protein